jgi:UDP-N-acetylglucosamine--dolichyl-phosphate N-acetylglucosaminephosphotransferase
MSGIYLVAAFAISLISSYAVVRGIYPRLQKAGMVGRDVNKPERPEVAEMGGIGVVAGMCMGVLACIFFNVFSGFGFELDFVLAALASVLMLAIVGMVDDLLDIPQSVKALLPLVAGIPLMAMRAAGSTVMSLPFFGPVDFGYIYIFIAIPMGIAVASNLTNMLAGFNGLEAGMGIVLISSASLAAIYLGSAEALVLYVPLIGALAGFLILNRYPSKVFPGDVATLTIGATLAAGSIIGNFETIAALLLLLYVADFFVKLANRFPSSKWWGEWKGGKLYPVEGKVRGLCQLIMKHSGGISEQKLVLLLILSQAAVSALVLLAFLHFKVL